MTAAVPIVRIDNVSKRFIIQKSKSLKERIVNAGRSAKFKRTSGPCATSTSRSRPVRRSA